MDQRELREEQARTTEYQWENCVICGKSEKQYFIETGWAMLIWHTDIGPLCEDCWPEHDPLENISESQNQPEIGPDYYLILLTRKGKQIGDCTPLEPGRA